MLRKTTFTILFLIISSLLSPSFSKVYLSKDKALKLAFPDAERIDKITIFLSEEELRQIESIAHTKIKSKIYIFYVGKKKDEIVGYAVIDTHILRTKTETLIIVINPDGTLRRAEILAFFEPTDYMPSKKWIGLFNSKKLNESMRVGRDIPNITGATITSNSLTESIRKILAVYRVSVEGKS